MDFANRHLQEGSVTYTYIDNFVAAAKQLTASNDHRYRAKFKQWIVYSMCLRDYGARHRWMGALAFFASNLQWASNLYRVICIALMSTVPVASVA